MRNPFRYKEPIDYDKDMVKLLKIIKKTANKIGSEGFYFKLTVTVINEKLNFHSIVSKSKIEDGQQENNNKSNTYIKHNTQDENTSI